MRMTPNIDIWFIGRNENNSIMHYAFNRANHMLGCGLPIFEEYDNEADWIIRLKELGLTPEE